MAPPATPTRAVRLEVSDWQFETRAGRLGPNVSFALECGQGMLLTGPLGSGKSLLSEHLAGFARPGIRHSGSVRFYDAEGSPTEARVALTPEDVRLVALGTDRVRSLTGHLHGVEEWLERLELSPGRIMDLWVRSLAQSERKRLFLACALASAAPLVVVDGFGESLDPSLRGVLRDTMERAISQGKMLLVTSREQRPAGFETWPLLHLDLPDALSVHGMPLLPKAAVRAEGESNAPPVLEVQSLEVVARRRHLLARASVTRPVDGASLFLRRGEILTVLGPAASGKSTLLEAIAGLVPLAAGRVRVSGIDVTPAKGRLRRIARRVQLVPEDAPAMFDARWSVGRHLRGSNGKSATSLTPDAWLERLGLLGELRDLTPDVLCTGEAVRLSLALALAAEPRVVLFDCPRAGGLDTDGGTLTGLLLAERNAGRSFVLATSDPGVARALSDRIALLDAGRLIELGPRAEVLERMAHPRAPAILAGERGPLHDPRRSPVGCHVAGSCEREVDRCKNERPLLQLMPNRARSHRVACFNPLPTGAPLPEGSSSRKDGPEDAASEGHPSERNPSEGNPSEGNPSEGNSV